MQLSLSNGRSVAAGMDLLLVARLVTKGRTSCAVLSAFLVMCILRSLVLQQVLLQMVVKLVLATALCMAAAR